MDKQKVIEAYRRGLISLKECGQILGAEKQQMDDLISGEYGRKTIHSSSLYIVDHV